MKRLCVAFVTIAALAVPVVAGAQKHKPAPRSETKTEAAGSSSSSDGGKATIDPKTGQKTKQYTFGGLDIDGKLKTPQLLYFLNRMKSEFDTTAPDKRSFIPELKRSTDEM